MTAAETTVFPTFVSVPVTKSPRNIPRLQTDPYAGERRLEHDDESIDQIIREVGVDGDAQPRRAWRHAGRPDGAHVEAVGLHRLRNRNRGVVVADEDRDDVRRACSCLDAGLEQADAQLLRDLAQPGAALRLPFDDV